MNSTVTSPQTCRRMNHGDRRQIILQLLKKYDLIWWYEAGERSSYSSTRTYYKFYTSALKQHEWL